MLCIGEGHDFQKTLDSDNCYMATLLLTDLKKASKLAETCGLKILGFYLK
jgi:hypothetical protein